MDPVDEEILRVLEEDARTPLGDVAAMVDLEEEEVEGRLESLEEEGVIRGYRTVIDWERAGAEHVYAYIDLDVELQRETGYDEIAERITRFDEVESLRLVSGTTDLRLVVKGSSMKEVAFFVAEKISSLEQVRDTVTSFVLKSYKESGVVLRGEEESGRLPVTP